MVEGGMKCVKYILFAFNLLFFLAGLGLIISGAIVQVKLKEYFGFFGDNISAAAILLIVVGAVIFVIGFFGCCGAYKENYCMTMTFAVLLGIIFILEIAAGIAAYVMREKVQDVISDNMMKAMGNFGTTDHEGVTKTWNSLQNDFDCCGTKNYTDWEDKGSLASGDVPDSCCTEEVDDCGKGQLTNPTLIYTDGCLNKFVQWVKDNIIVIGGVGIGLAVIQIFGIIIACCLAQAIRKEYETV